MMNDENESRSTFMDRQLLNLRSYEVTVGRDVMSNEKAPGRIIADMKDGTWFARDKADDEGSIIDCDEVAYVREDILATVRAEEREAAIAALCPVLCGSCSNVANGLGTEGSRTLLDGHWVHLWTETNGYAGRCGADVAIRALTENRKGEG